MADENTGGAPAPANAPPPGPGNGNGNGNGNPQPSHPHPHPAAEPPEPRPPVKTVVMLPDDYAAQQRELNELRAFREETQNKIEMQEAERLKALAAKGQSDEAMNQLKSAYETKTATLQSDKEWTEREWLSEKKTSVLNQALAGIEFAGVDPTLTAQHVRRLLEGEIDSVMGRDRKPTVHAKQTLQPAEEYLRERLASPEFALYLKPSGKGGSGTNGTRTAPASSAAAQPGSLDQIVADWRNKQAQFASFGLHPSRS